MLLHGSKVQFDNFRIPSHGNELSGASNGMLGTWFCRETHAFIAEGYGREGWVAEVAEPCSDDVVEIPLGKFIRWHEEADRDDPAAYYGDIRSKLLARGKTWIALVEKDGSSPTLVCLAPQDLVIENWRSNSEPVAEQSPCP